MRVNKIVAAFFSLVFIFLIVLQIHSQMRIKTYTEDLKFNMAMEIKSIASSGVLLIQHAEANDEDAFSDGYISVQKNFGSYVLINGLIFKSTDVFSSDLDNPIRAFWTDTVSSVLFHVPSKLSDCTDENVNWTNFKTLVSLLTDIPSESSLEEMIDYVEKDERSKSIAR